MIKVMKFSLRTLRNIKRLKYPLIKRFFGLKQLLRVQFKDYYGYPLNLTQPNSLSEKIMWIKLHHDLDDLSPYVDKITVREYVRRTIGEPYLIPCLGIHDSVNDIDFDILPNQFVIKASHGCNWNIIVKDKNICDKEQIKRKFDQWLKTTYGTETNETCYRPIKGRILIETYLEEDSKSPRDYKFYCCDGEPLGLHVDFDRFGDATYRCYDTEWREFKKSIPTLPIPPLIPKPSNFDEMLEVCRKLSKGFSYVRVDLYNCNNQIYFGELTFTPGDGRAPFNPVWLDYFFGEPLDIKSYQPRYIRAGV